jgi:hypothetical protein
VHKESKSHEGESGYCSSQVIENRKGTFSVVFMSALKSEEEHKNCSYFPFETKNYLKP